MEHRTIELADDANKAVVSYGDEFFAVDRRRLPSFAKLDVECARRSALRQKELDVLLQQLPTAARPPSSLYAYPEEEALIVSERRWAERRRANQRGSDAKPNGVRDRLPQLKEGVFSFGTRSGRLEGLVKLVTSVFDEPVRCSGDFLYGPGGFRAWHTNAFDQPGWRMYLVDTSQVGGSFFSFISPSTGQMITYRDRWLRAAVFFEIRQTPLFWHCIGSEKSWRYSKGFIIPSDWRTKILPWVNG